MKTINQSGLNNQGTGSSQGGFLDQFNQQFTNSCPSQGVGTWSIQFSRRNVGGINYLACSSGNIRVVVQAHDNSKFPSVIEDINGNRLNDSTANWDRTLDQAVRRFLEKNAVVENESAETSARETPTGFKQEGPRFEANEHPAHSNKRTFPTNDRPIHADKRTFPTSDRPTGIRERVSQKAAALRPDLSMRGK